MENLENKKDLTNENIVDICKNGIQYFQFRKLLEYKDILTHAYSIGKENFRTNKSKDKPIDEIEYKNSMYNYRKLCDAIGCNFNNLIKPIQRHTNQVKIVEKKINKDKPGINLIQYEDLDGIITSKKDLVLASTNADCILFLFFDPIKKVIANVHSGWRGTSMQISVETIKKMKTLGCMPENIICCIMPSIRKCHFEVKEDVKNIFYNQCRNMKELNEIITKDDKGETWFVDTVKINQILLKKEGLKEENIIDSGICSVCNSDLIHSYRVEKQNFSLATAIISLI